MAEKAESALAYLWQDTATRVAASIDAWTNPTPPRLVLSLPDLWGGDPEIGRHVCAGRFVIGDQHWAAPQGDVWSNQHVPPVWTEHVLSFAFLPHLRASGSDAGRREARHHIERFMARFGLRPDPLGKPEIMAKRIVQWLTHFDFYGTTAQYDFQLEVRRSLTHQVKALMKTEAAPGLPALWQSCALVLAGIVIEDQPAARALGMAWLDSVLRDFVKEGGVATRRPQDVAEALCLIVTLRCALMQAGKAVPEGIKRAIDEMTAGLRCIRGGDKKLPVFQGGLSCRAETIDQILRRADSRARHGSTRVMGYERMAQGRSLVFFDVGGLPPVDHDEQAHAAPLAFELWVGKDRVITQCGASAFLPPETKRALRGTSAHSTLCVDERNVCEIRETGGLGRRFQPSHCQRWELEGGGIMIDAMQNGYQDLFGLTHQRKLALIEDGECLAGEDVLSSDAALLRPHYVTTRFHLHPRIQASLIQDDTEVLLRLPGGGGWRFSADGGPLKLEQSLYCGSGRPRPTLHIAVEREMTQAQLSIPWVLQAELPS